MPLTDVEIEAYLYRIRTTRTPAELSKEKLCLIELLVDDLLKETQRGPLPPYLEVRELMAKHNFTVGTAAKRCGMTGGNLSSILSGKTSVTPKASYQLGRLFNKPLSYFAEQQVRYEVAKLNGSITE